MRGNHIRLFLDRRTLVAAVLLGRGGVVGPPTPADAAERCFAETG
jgi:hypothetical protein